MLSSRCYSVERRVVIAVSKYVRLMRSIWTDPDWLDLPSRSKMVYLQLISQANISKTGVLPTVPRRWASMYPDLEVDDILAAVEQLSQAGFVVVDFDTEELLVRTYMRYDEMYNQPNGRKAIAAALDEIVSVTLRAAVEEELLELLADPSDNPSRNPSVNPSGKGSATPRTLNLEPRTLNPEPRTTAVAVLTDGEWESFWSAYPRKTGKAQAEKAWGKLKPVDRTAALAALPEHVGYWQRNDTATQFIPHPATWLNGRRWEDDLPQDRPKPQRKEAPGMNAVRRLMEEAQNGS